MKYTTLALLLAVVNVVGAEEEIPGSAQDDINKDAATKAAEDIAAFDAGKDADYKAAERAAGKYDTLDDAGKTALDAEIDGKLKTMQDARKKRDDDEKTAAGYASMTPEQKTIFDDGLLKWKKAVHDACKADKTAEACTKADELRKAIEDKRNTDGYYQKSLSEREADDKVRADAEAKKAAETQAADADKKAEDGNKDGDKATEKTEEEKKKEEEEKKKAEEAAKPKAGEAGFRCEKSGDTRPTCNDGLCCGAAKKEGATDVIETCQKKDATVYKHKKDAAAKEEDWAFACIEGAHSVAASAAAALAAAYMLA